MVLARCMCVCVCVCADRFWSLLVSSSLPRPFRTILVFPLCVHFVSSFFWIRLSANVCADVSLGCRLAVCPAVQLRRPPFSLILGAYFSLCTPTRAASRTFFFLLNHAPVASIEGVREPHYHSLIFFCDPVFHLCGCTQSQFIVTSFSSRFPRYRTPLATRVHKGEDGALPSCASATSAERSEKHTKTPV